MKVSPDVAKFGLKPGVIIILPIPFLILATIALALRLYVRLFTIRSFGWDDAFLVAAYFFFAADCGAFIGIGVVEMTQGLGPLVLLGLLSTAGMLLYLLDQICFKLSLAFFFLRIVTRKWQRMIIIVTVAIYTAFNFGLLFVVLFQCGNPAAINTTTTTCMNWDTILGPVLYFSATLNAVVDWIFALTPVLVIRTLHMGRQDKLSVIAMIVLAISGSIISVVRIPYIPGLRLDSNYYSATNDVIAYTSVIESGIGIIVASLCVLRPLVRQWVEKARTTLLASKNSDSYPMEGSAGKRAATPQAEHHMRNSSRNNRMFQVIAEGPTSSLIGDTDIKSKASITTSTIDSRPGAYDWSR